jgi:hypothetical protein
MRLSNIRALYPAFENIFERHVKDAKFDGVPMKGRSFRYLKLGVISLIKILDEHQRLRRETRSALFQALVVDHDFQQALSLLPKKSNIITRWISSFWSDAGEDESFKYEMKRTAAQVPDSQFLLDLERFDDEDLQSAAQKARALAKRELSSSIDAVVTTMTNDVLAMQQDLCGRQAQLLVEKEEREVLKIQLVEFIREINMMLAKSKNSCVSFFILTS